EDIDDLLLFCECDSTSKFQHKRERYLQNINNLRQQLQELEERDKLRQWQPPISGEEIMKTFGLKPSREVGIIKNAIREAILDGDIPNNYEDAYQFMLRKGAELDLQIAD
ncbi:MAG: tRNA nucleotidyltransferase, partial [Saprospiraceae bacterium]|nr:tRNA nucleotidyltransferase [Saprospiraceae bacterium]